MNTEKYLLKSDNSVSVNVEYEKDLHLTTDADGYAEEIVITKRSNGLIILKATPEGLTILDDLKKAGKIKLK